MTPHARSLGESLGYDRKHTCSLGYDRKHACSLQFLHTMQLMLTKSLRGRTHRCRSVPACVYKQQMFSDVTKHQARIQSFFRGKKHPRQRVYLQSNFQQTVGFGEKLMLYLKST